MWQFFYCGMCHNLEPSLTIIMDDANQYFKKTICPKILITCHMSDFIIWTTINDMSMTSWV